MDNIKFLPRDATQTRYCHGKSVRCSFVCPSVRPSVSLSLVEVYRGNIGRNSWKIISRLISLTFPFYTNPNITNLLQRKHPQNFSGNRSGVGKIVDFQHLSRRISETVQDRSKLLLTTNRNMYTHFQLVAKIIDDLE